MRLRLYFDKFGDILIPYPSYDEQIKIVEYIENQTTKIDKAIELQQNYILKLKEYKASLIDSVVTGKVRVAWCGIKTQLFGITEQPLKDWNIR